MKPISDLVELLRARAREAPDKPYLLFKDDVYTRAELDSASDAAAWELKGKGVRPGDRVALLLPNCPEFIVYFFAALKLGAVAVPVNFWFKEPEVVYVLRNCGAAGILLGPAFHGMADGLKAQCPELRFAARLEQGGKQTLLDLRLPAEGVELLRSVKIDPEAVCDIIYTSGTTGFPKGAMLSHKNWLADIAGLSEGIGMTGADRVLTFLPLFHVNSQGIGLLSTLYQGGSIGLMEKFAPKDFFESLSRWRCTSFSSVPSIYSVLLSLPEADRYDLSSLRYCICGGAPMPVEVFERFEAKFKAHILEGYGLSEGSCATCVNPPPPAQRKVGCIGLPLSGQSMRIVDDRDRELPDGQVGEIVVRGDNVMLGYWNNPQATAETLRGGWLHTGDLGTRDPEGYFYIVGRKKEMIIRGGENVYPKEIEEALYQHPAVLEAAVIGLPDRRYGEEVAAFLVLKDGAALTAREVTGFLRSKIADFKIPRQVEFVPAFPKTATGKIQKLKFREAWIEAHKQPAAA